MNIKYKDFQEAIEGRDSELYPATNQRAEKVGRQKNPRNEQPVKLRNDILKFENKIDPLVFGLRSPITLKKGVENLFGVQ